MNPATHSARHIPLDEALDQLLSPRWSPARGPRIRSASELPWRFRQIVQTLRAGTWRAYGDDTRLGFAVGEFTSAAGGDTGPALAVSFYDADAHRCAAGVWTMDTAGHWMLHDVLD